MSELSSLPSAVNEWLTVDRVFFLVWIFNAAVQALPEPVEGQRFYLFFFRLCHTAAANINVVRKKPQANNGPAGVTV